MDLNKTIRQLYEQRNKLDRVIASLEELQKNAGVADSAPKKRRGRKSMDAAARKEVSERMRRYWESRRKQKQNASPSA